MTRAKRTTESARRIDATHPTAVIALGGNALAPSGETSTIYDQFRTGNFGALRAWQKKHLHRFGSKYSPRATTEKFLGSPLSHEPYVRYLAGRVNEFYG